MTRKSLPSLPSLQTIMNRLPLIFPEGIAHRNYLIREMAAKTVFVMLYVGAVEGASEKEGRSLTIKFSDVSRHVESGRGREFFT